MSGTSYQPSQPTQLLKGYIGGRYPIEAAPQLLLELHVPLIFGFTTLFTFIFLHVFELLSSPYP